MIVQQRQHSSTDPSGFYGDKKYCYRCRRYVRYLCGGEHSYCAEHPNERVSNFSPEDWKKFKRFLAAESAKNRKNYMGGRPLPWGTNLGEERKRLGEALRRADELLAIRTLK